MDKIKNLNRNWLGAGLILAFVSANIAPAAAESVIIINGVRHTPVGDTFIYGNQTYNRIRVNPVTGKTDWNNDSRYRQGNDYRYPTSTIYTYPQYRQNIINPGLNTPSVVNPIFRNSTIRNPVFDNHPAYRQGNDYRYPTSTIYTYPQYRQNIINPGLNTPSVVNPIFRNSTIRNPVFDNHPAYRQPSRGRSRVNILYP